MDKRINYWLRWMAVLPGALIAGLLSSFLLRLVLFQTLTNFIEPYPEFPERALTPFVISLTFIWIGCEIAPEYKLKTGITLFTLWLLLSAYFIFSTFTSESWYGNELFFQAGGVAPIMGIVGTFVGFYIVRRKFR